ncbi:MAG: DNA replication/repair protein RecF [Patescibacteria group bacterium]
MKLLKLQLENFRSYKKHKFEFGKNKKLTLLVGENGTGKTNLLEAIYVLSLGRSFRSLFRDDLISWGDEYLRLNADISYDDEESANLEVFYENKPTKRKNFKKNGLSLKGSEYVGSLLTVLFHPEDLNMLVLSPSLRRRYMDIILCQTDKKYLYALSKYKKVLRQRNALLQGLRIGEDLEVWDKELVEFGSVIIEKRIMLINFFNEKIENIYRMISGGKERVSMEYESKIIKKIPNRNFAGQNFPIKKLYEDELFNRRQRDIKRMETSSGPHRDDIKFYINGKEIISSASRGELRTLILAMKLVEIEFIKEKTGTYPVLLLDDVFSELDKNRKSHLMESIQNCQAVITATDIDSLKSLGKDGAGAAIVRIE